MGNHSGHKPSHYLMEHDGITARYYGRCPKCASKEVQRSRRKNFFERIIGAAVLPWRCNICYARFFRPFWFEAEPRRLDIRRHFEKKSHTPRPRRTEAARANLFGWSEETLPGFIKRNPTLAFLIPTRSHVRHVKHAMPLGTK